MNEEVINIAELLTVLRRHAFAIIALLACTLGLAVIALNVLPKTYKASAVLGIQTAYFKNPLISDFITQSDDPGEINSQRMALLRLALDTDFIDSLGEKYGIYASRTGSSERLIERDLLLKNIEYISGSSTTVNISVNAKVPDTAYSMLREVVTRMVNTLDEERHRTLVKARDSIQAQATFLGKALKNSSVPSDVEFLQTELAKLEAQIDAMRLRYTDNHPEMVQLRQQAQGMRSRINRSLGGKGELAVTPENEAVAEPISEALGQKGSRQSLEGIYNDLVKKLSFLTITLNIDSDKESKNYLSLIEEPNLPTSPVKPKKPVILGLGFISGLLLSAFYVVVKEIKRGSFLSPFRAAETLGVSLLGELPFMDSHQDFVESSHAFNPKERGASSLLLLPRRARRDS
jgi:capsular polysaccharide biosynthesis protein